MAKEESQQKLKRLWDEIEELKNERLDHQHPKFKTWRKEVKATLKRLYGDESPALRQFEGLEFHRRGDQVWGEDYNLSEKEREVFKDDLERARTILEGTMKLAPAPLSVEEKAGIDEEKFVSSVSSASSGTLQETPSSLNDQQAAPEMLPQKAVKDEAEADIDQLLQELETDKRELENVQTTLEAALEDIGVHSGEGRVEELLKELERQIKDPHVQMHEVQRTMNELLKAKGREALVQRLIMETKDPSAPWGKIKGLMRGVWEIDKKFLLDILPDLLGD